MKLVGLRPGQTIAKKFKHPLLDDAKVYSAEEIDTIAQSVILADSDRQLLFMALRSALRNLVGRYLYYFPQCRRFEEDLVSEGLLALHKFVMKLTESDLDDPRGILKIACIRINGSIRYYMNNNQAMLSARWSKQFELIEAGSEPIYFDWVDFHSIKMEGGDDNLHPLDDGDECKRDFLDALDSLTLEDEIDEALICRENWGRGSDIAKELGVSRQLVDFRKQRLYKQFLEITKGDE